MRRYVELSRPFTLVAPALGFFSGGLTAVGAAPREPWSAELILYPLVGALMAAVLNAASNALNQIYDLEIDRINKPSRPLVTGEVSIRGAWIFTWIMYALGTIPTWLVVVYPYNTWTQKLFAPLEWHECFFIYVIALISTFIYSVPALGRTKAHPIGANLTIAIPRGLLLKVAGWTMVARALDAEPWYIGAIFMLFLLGAASTKDFSDMKGDAAGGCRTLPIAFGVRKAAWMISPFFVIPWLLMPIGTATGVLTGNATFISILGIVLALWGVYTVWLIVRNPDELTATENHPSWRHMYLMMMAAQIGFALAYLV